MERLGVSGFDAVSGGVTKKRRSAARRSRPDPQEVGDVADFSPSSTTPPLDTGDGSSGNVSKVSSDENGGYETSFQGREFNSKVTVPRVGSVNKFEGENGKWEMDSRNAKKIKRDNGNFGEFKANHAGTIPSNNCFQGMSMGNEYRRNGIESKRCSEGVLAPANWKSTSNHKINQGKEDTELQIKGRLGPRGTDDDYLCNGRNLDGHYLGQSGARVGGDESGGSCSKTVQRQGDFLLQENKLRKVKLKLVRNIQEKPDIDSDTTQSSALRGSSATTPLHSSSEATRQRKKLILQGNLDEENQSPRDKANCLQGIPWKDFTVGNFTFSTKEGSRGKTQGERISGQQEGKSSSVSTCKPVHRSKRAPKKRAVDDGVLNDDEDDDEIRYLERLKISRASAVDNAKYGDDKDEVSKKQRRVFKTRTVDGESEEDAGDHGLSRPRKEGRTKMTLARDSTDMDYIVDDEHASDSGSEAKNNKQKKESLDCVGDGKREISLTTRQRALQSSKDKSGGNGTNVIEFQNGLPPTAPRRQKEKLSEVEQQLKKVEAAQRRRIQVEKAAKELEAEAIRKILGQDSSRKKKEDKIRKRQDELAQERAANAMIIAANTVRWIMGPSGTTISFPKDAEFPSIFNSKPCSYPPPREKCAGPSCTNPYKYRDSKSKLPLCSLQCYQAIHEMMQA